MPNYFVDIFSPETYDIFTASDRSISGFTENKSKQVAAVRPGDRFVCYITKLSRWVGLLEVVDESFRDSTPRFVDQDDPYLWRFRVRPLVWLSPLEKAIPIFDDASWQHLSFTKDLGRDNVGWTSWVRSPLRKLSEHDSECLERLLIEQATGGHTFPLSERDQKKLKASRVKVTDNL